VTRSNNREDLDDLLRELLLKQYIFNCANLFKGIYKPNLPNVESKVHNIGIVFKFKADAFLSRN